MSLVRDLLARVVKVADGCPASGPCGDCRETAETMAATPAGRALAAVVEAAEYVSEEAVESGYRAVPMQDIEALRDALAAAREAAR